MQLGDDDQQMTPTRPYLVRAFYEWIIDNDLTPYILVDATDERIRVPEQYIEDGKIVLNMSAMAIRDLDINNRFIAFRARFAGVIEDIYVTMASVLAIYAKENGRGMAFEDDFAESESDDGGNNDDPPPSTSTKKGRGKGHLSVVK